MAAILGSSSPESQLGGYIPVTMQGRVADTVFAESLPAENDDAVVPVDGQPQLAPEETKRSAPATIPGQSRTHQAPADAAATSAVELSGSTIAALVFAWQLRVGAAATENERRKVERVR